MTDILAELEQAMRGALEELPNLTNDELASFAIDCCYDGKMPIDEIRYYAYDIANELI